MIPEDLDAPLRGKLDSLERKLAKRRALPDGFKGDKVVNEVLDRSTVMAIYGMIRRGTISYVNGPVSAGKESVVFWAVAGDSDVALKVYLVSASNFNRRAMYMDGDPRFERAKKGTRNTVYLWAAKEFRNMTLCHKAGIRAPRPVAVSKNVLAMEFLGEGGRPYPALHDTAVDGADYGEAVRILGQMHAAGLVHGDYSEYNVLKTPSGLAVFDLGSAVDRRHPGSADLLWRDINNINRFFAKRGVHVEDADTVLGMVKG